MGRIVHTWELGGGYGHLSGFVPVAAKLKARGYDVTLVVKELMKAETVLKERGVDYLQAPMHLSSVRQAGDAVSYAEILLTAGFDSGQSLTARVKAWKKLFELLRPGVVILDYSPTALLTARIMSIPRVLFGSGFFVPPRVSPLPNYRSWLNVPASRLQQAERRVLTVVNEVLEYFGNPPLEMLADLFQADENMLCTFEALDHYEGRGAGTHYWGPRFNLSEGVAPDWLPGGEKKIFAYLHPFYPNLSRLLADLKSLPHSVLVYCPGVAPHLEKQFQSPTLRFVNQPVRIKDLATACDVVICHAGHGMVSGCLLAGLPVLMLPTHAEQMILAMKAANTGAATYVLPDNRQANYKKMIKALLTDAGYRQAARAFAEKHKAFDVGRRDDEIVARLEAIMARHTLLSQ